MADRRAVVLQREGVKYVLLTREGEFIRARLPRDAVVGEEVELPESALMGAPMRWLRLAALKPWGLTGVAAVLIFVLIFTVNWNLLLYSRAVAAVSLDINPRLELTLNKKSTILDVLPINAEAEDLVKGLKLRGESLKTGLREIIQAAKALNYLNQDQNWVVVGLSPVEDSTPLPATLTLEVIEETILEETTNLGIAGKVATIAVSPEERDQALTEGLTSAEYGLYQIAKHAGLDVSPETVKDTIKRKQLLENEAIQAEIKNKAANFLSNFQQKLQDKPNAHGQKSDNLSSKGGNASKGSDENMGMLWDGYLNPVIDELMDLNGFILYLYDLQADINGSKESQNSFNRFLAGSGYGKGMDGLSKSRNSKSRGEKRFESFGDGRQKNERQAGNEESVRSAGSGVNARAVKGENRSDLREQAQDKNLIPGQSSSRGSTSKGARNDAGKKSDTSYKNSDKRGDRSGAKTKGFQDSERERRQNQDLRSRIQQDFRADSLNAWLRWFGRY